jgi:hypothetical protein
MTSFEADPRYRGGAPLGPGSAPEAPRNGVKSPPLVGREMSGGAARESEIRIPNLAGTTIRRTISIGRIYLIIGVAVSLLLTLIIVVGAHSASAFATTYPLELPLFAVLGSTGGLMTFTSDRTKGVFEYLIAYGVRPRTLFFNGLLSTAAMSSIILGLALVVGLSAASANGVGLSQDLWKAIAFYTIPMSFAGALFTSTVGMLWTAVSTPRSGMNSPVGMAPMIGIAPTILVLIVAESAPRSEFYYITGGAALVIIAVVVVLIALSGQLMGRERFLSPL